MKTVWVLGAGFSRSLGGPLLTQLLTVTSIEGLALKYSEVRLRDDNAGRVRVLFQAGMRARYDGDPNPGAGLWGDAEEFVEYLDGAAEAPNGSLWSRINGLLVSKAGATTPTDIPAIRHTARRIIAAECCAFLHDANTKGERWEPYHDWAETLRGDDTIITFNYDRVLENLDGNIKGGPPGRNWHEHRIGSTCRILKLHGSVDWIRKLSSNGDALFAVAPTKDFAVTADDEAIAIATPGPTKRSAAKEFVELWRLAENALISADVIVFVGYRFPPSDAEARKKLLGAIVDNERPHLKLNVVLGENPGADGTRLEQLLRAACLKAGRSGDGRLNPSAKDPPTSFAIKTHMMRAEDFFTVWSPAIID